MWVANSLIGDREPSQLYIDFGILFWVGKSPPLGGERPPNPGEIPDTPHAKVCSLNPSGTRNICFYYTNHTPAYTKFLYNRILSLPVWSCDPVRALYGDDAACACPPRPLAAKKPHHPASRSFCASPPPSGFTISTSYTTLI